MDHLHWKLRESDFFLHAMKNQSKAVFGGIRPLGFTWTNPEHYQGAMVFLFELSAMLSAFRCVSYYLENACNRTTAGAKWYKDQEKEAAANKTLLAAFCFLRDSDIHEDTIKGGVRHTSDAASQTTDSQFCFDTNAVSQLAKFKKTPWAIDLIRNRPIIELAEEALVELRAVVDKGRRLKHV